jgi:hypothetical protein
MDNAETIRRTYNRARLTFDRESEFSKDVARAFVLLLHWRETAVNPNWGLMISHPSGLHIDIRPKNHKTLFHGIDRLQKILETELGEKPGQ